MILMALGTFAIGCIPSQSSIGILAPILLLVARLVQGFSTGGEYGNAMTFIAEYAPDRKRGFLGSWLEFGTFTGYIMGAIIVTVAGRRPHRRPAAVVGLADPVLRGAAAGPRRRLPAHPARGHPGVPRPGEGVRGAREGAAQRERRRAQEDRPPVAVHARLHRPGAGLERHQLHADLLHADLRHHDDAGHAGRSERLGDHLADPADRGDGRGADHDPAARPALGPDRPQADRVVRLDRPDRARRCPPSC